MSITTKTAGTLTLLGAIIAAPVMAEVTWDLTPGDLNTAIKKVTVRDVTPSAPIITVSSSDGKSYDNVKPGTLKFQAKYDAECRGLLHVKKAQLEFDSFYNGISFPFQMKDRIWHQSTGPSGKRKTNSATVDFGGPISSIIANRAKAQCNKLVKNGEVPTNATVFGKDEDWVILYHAQCGTNTSNRGTSYQTAKVVYRCEGYKKPPPPPTPPPTAGGGGQLAAKFQVTKLVADTNPTKYTGSCPVNIKFGGKITVNRSGTVKYRWVTSVSGPGPVQSMKFTKAGTKQTPQPTMTVKDGATSSGGVGGFKATAPSGQKPDKLTQTEPGTSNHFVQLKIVSPLSKPSMAEKHLVVKCTKSTGGSKVTAPTSGGEGNNQADVAFTRNKLGKNRFHVGTKSKRWGGTMNLNANDASKVLNNGRCEFNFKYSIINRGGVKTEKAFKAQLKKGNQQLHTKNDINLNSKQAVWVAGKLQLNSGTHQLQANLDHNNKVKESNENNNSRKVKLKVTGCN